MNNSEWREGIQALHDEAAGVLTVDIIDATRGTKLLCAAAGGDYEAMILLQAIAAAAMQVKAASRRKPALCCCCPRAVRRVTRTTVFGVAAPAVAKPTRVAAFVICARCSADSAALPAKYTQGLRRLWPDLRPITIHREAGRA